MKTVIHKFIVSGLLAAILASSPMFLSAQQKFLGELSITKYSSEGFVTVNGEPVISSRSITSPSLIQTSPQADSKVLLAKTGTVTVSPNSKLNLSFVSSSISMDIVSGEVIVETLPNTSLNIFTPDGNSTLPIENQANSIKVKVVDGKTSIETLIGKTQFNGVPVSAGETYPLTANKTIPNKPVEKDDKSSNSSKGFNPLLIVGILGAVGAVALIALSSSSGNDDTPVVSPNR